jgi:hypothetical protein
MHPDEPANTYKLQKVIDNIILANDGSSQYWRSKDDKSGQWEELINLLVM